MLAVYPIPARYLPEVEAALQVVLSMIRVDEMFREEGRRFIETADDALGGTIVVTIADSAEVRAVERVA